ncbi:MAG: ABC transporter ATP-binding protein [Candidatus Zixiibacteriota bacterium]|nr:MAG: ABC transporter ATP-binding protein [candidate division Zixibacteria bacterium]
MAVTAMNIIDMRKITKTYQTGKVDFQALKGIDLTVQTGEFISIVGPSGSGKSTMMNIIGCLDTPTSGEYRLDGELVNTLPPNQLADIRNRKVGFVFQAFNLLPYATAYENVEVPLLFARVNGRRRRERIMTLLARVGLADKANNKPTEMSGGEMQRVAIARALANEPEIILADEPTGNLDTKSGAEIIKLFHELWQTGKTIIMITHDMNIASQTQRLVRIRDGIIEGNGQPA